jgi:hypothetical protein
MTPKEPIAKSPRGRVSRTRVGQRNILTVKNKDPNYEYRIVNDIGDRIAMFEEAGYELVDAADVQVGDKRVSKATPEGSKAQVAVGGGNKGYVMRIRKEWYDEDQKAKQAHLDEVENTMKQEALNGTYGKLEIKRD